MTMGLGFIRR